MTAKNKHNYRLSTKPGIFCLSCEHCVHNKDQIWTHCAMTLTKNGRPKKVSWQYICDQYDPIQAPLVEVK